jgi:hypothetical protein
MGQATVKGAGEADHDILFAVDPTTAHYLRYLTVSNSFHNVGVNLVYGEITIVTGSGLAHHVNSIAEKFDTRSLWGKGEGGYASDVSGLARSPTFVLPSSARSIRLFRLPGLFRTGVTVDPTETIRLPARTSVAIALHRNSNGERIMLIDSLMVDSGLCVNNKLSLSGSIGSTSVVTATLPDAYHDSLVYVQVHVYQEGETNGSVGFLVAPSAVLLSKCHPQLNVPSQQECLTQLLGQYSEHYLRYADSLFASRHMVPAANEIGGSLNLSSELYAQVRKRFGGLTSVRSNAMHRSNYWMTERAGLEPFMYGAYALGLDRGAESRSSPFVDRQLSVTVNITRPGFVIVTTTQHQNGHVRTVALLSTDSAGMVHHTADLSNYDVGDYVLDVRSTTGELLHSIPFVVEESE